MLAMSFESDVAVALCGRPFPPARYNEDPLKSMDLCGTFSHVAIASGDPVKQGPSRPKDGDTNTLRQRSQNAQDGPPYP